MKKIMKRGEGYALIPQEFNAIMEIVVSALQEKGYDPYAQLYGYVYSENPLYITQHKNARQLILTLERDQIKQYIEKIK